VGLYADRCFPAVALTGPRQTGNHAHAAPPDSARRLWALGRSRCSGPRVPPRPGRWSRCAGPWPVVRQSGWRPWIGLPPQHRQARPIATLSLRIRDMNPDCRFPDLPHPMPAVAPLAAARRHRQMKRPPPGGLRSCQLLSPRGAPGSNGQQATRTRDFGLPKENQDPPGLPLKSSGSQWRSQTNLWQRGHSPMNRTDWLLAGSRKIRPSLRIPVAPQT